LALSVTRSVWPTTNAPKTGTTAAAGEIHAIAEPSCATLTASKPQSVDAVEHTHGKSRWVFQACLAGGGKAEPRLSVTCENGQENARMDPTYAAESRESTESRRHTGIDRSQLPDRPEAIRERFPHIRVRDTSNDLEPELHAPRDEAGPRCARASCRPHCRPLPWR